MKNTPYKGYLGNRMLPEVARKRIDRVVREEMTELERETLIAYYFQEKNIPEIARARGVNKSSVSRALKRAEMKLKRYLKY